MSAHRGASASRPPGLASGCTLTLLFEGSPAVYTDYPRAEALETATAVTIIPVAVELYDGPRPDFVEQWQVTAVVADPIGARVVIDHMTGCPIGVTTVPLDATP